MDRLPCLMSFWICIVWILVQKRILTYALPLNHVLTISSIHHSFPLESSFRRTQILVRNERQNYLWQQGCFKVTWKMYFIMTLDILKYFSWHLSKSFLLFRSISLRVATNSICTSAYDFERPRNFDFYPFKMYHIKTLPAMSNLPLCQEDLFFFVNWMWSI